MDYTDVFDAINRRASIRKYEDRPVPQETVAMLVGAGQRAPYSGQLCSVIVSTDSGKRNAVSEWLGVLPKQAPLFMLFCVDLRRLHKFVSGQGRQVMLADSALLWLGIQDVCYFAENVVLAAEGLGLGSCFQGGVPWFSRELCALFSVPERVFPVVGLVVGYPAEHPKPRVRIPLKFILHEDGYHDLTEEEVSEALSIMDADVLREDYYKKILTQFRHMEGEPELSDDEYTYGEHTSRKFGTRSGRWGRDLRDNLLQQGIGL